MKHLIRFLMGILVPALMLAFATATPAMAQEKAKDMKAAKAEKGKVKLKELFENDKVRVLEATFKPGDEAANVARPFQIIRALKGGTLTRIYPDGKTEKVTYKTGEVKVLEARPAFIPKNEGKSDIVLYVVSLKEPKK